jgi:hypothetical protein
MSLNIDLSNIKTNTVEEEAKEVEEEVKSNTSKLSRSLALNLENVASIAEEEEILSEFNIDCNDIDRLVAAIGAGLATESVINARILDENLVQEAKGILKTVVRKGKLTKKMICPEGFKASKSGMCERMSSTDIIAFKKRGMKAAKSRARHAPLAASMKSRKRSMLVRGANAGRVNRLSPAPAHTQVN